MRLEQFEADAIKATARRFFGERCTVRLFGSRVDDNRKGGDIDLHIVPETPAHAALETETAFEVALQDAIGEQKIDVVVQSPGRQDSPIDNVAKSTGIVL
jgi:predicted nucleotidyltransferase